jgi:MYXO-CTERM domain-containing protein
MRAWCADTSETAGERALSAIDRLMVSELHAWDRRGRTLPARMRAERRRLWLEVDDRDAEYPVVIDLDRAPEESGCACSAPAVSAGRGAWLLALVLLGLRRGRRGDQRNLRIL